LDGVFDVHKSGLLQSDLFINLLTLLMGEGIGIAITFSKRTGVSCSDGNVHGAAV